MRAQTCKDKGGIKLRRTVLVALLGLLLLSAPVDTRAETTQELDRDLRPVRPADTAQPNFSGIERLALVIGNSDYQQQFLKNPINDVKAMEVVLRKRGFKVISGSDLDRKGMRKLIRKFGKRLKSTLGVGFFYYAGHGVQYQGKNYLIPLRADIEEEHDIPDDAISVDRILSTMDAARNKINIMVLDACRNNPFPKSFRWSAGAGFAAMDPKNRAVGTYIAYSTGKGQKAKDGEGKHSPFAKHLLVAMETPGLDVEQLFKLVRTEVKNETGGKQTPWSETSLVGDSFYFLPTGGVTVQSDYVLPTRIPPKPDYTFGYIALPTAVLLLLGLLAYQRQRHVAIPVADGGGGTAILLSKDTAGAAYQRGAVAYLCNANSKRVYGALLPDRPLIIGRSSQADITMHDEAISSQHLEIGWNPDRNKLWIKDMNSSNGVFLGQGDRVDVGEKVYIALNQVFYLAKKDLAFTLKEAAEDE